MIQFEAQEMEVMKRSGQVIGEVANSYISELYQLDRVQSVENFIRQLKNISLRAISIGKKEKEGVYTKSLADLVELINLHKKEYEEIKDIVLIYSTFYLGAIKYSKRGGKNE